MSKPDVVIIEGARTPIGRLGGALRDSSAVELGTIAIQAAVARAGVDAAAVQECVMGLARQAGNGVNPARLMAVGAGLPKSAPAHTVQQACVSGMKAAILGYQSIVLGDADVVVVGGVEHMSSIPYLNFDLRWGKRTGHVTVVDGMYRDGFLDPMCGSRHMGELADLLGKRYGIGREAQDRYAFESQQNALLGKKNGLFEKMIVPVPAPQPKGDPVLVREDEHPRPDTTLDKLAKLPPAFSPDGTITAGNASGITDGACALVLASRSRAEQLGLRPAALLRSYATAALAPEDYGIAPTPASRAALGRAGLPVGAIDLVEINEAFALQVLAVMQDLGLPRDRVNVYGGGISLGHPIGMSGARIILTLLYALREQGQRYGLATICGNGGHGGALVIERC
jgi:acetyl-CoA C-acetyltransferase